MNHVILYKKPNILRATALPIFCAGMLLLLLFPYKMNAATIMVYIQRFQDDTMYHVALEDGIMSSLFDSGYLVLNSRPHDVPLQVKNNGYILWLRTLAANIDADHVFFVEYHLENREDGCTIHVDYTFMNILLPGNITAGGMQAVCTFGQNTAQLRKSIYPLGTKIAEEVLMKWAQNAD